MRDTYSYAGELRVEDFERHVLSTAAKARTVTETKSLWSANDVRTDLALRSELVDDLVNDAMEPIAAGSPREAGE